MEKSFNNIGDESMGFVIEVKENMFMDIKNICLDEKARSLFKVEHVLYLMILNMNKTNRIHIDRDFQDFVSDNVSISRAYLFKILKALTGSKMLERGEKRGWYKLNNIKKSLIQRKR